MRPERISFRIEAPQKHSPTPVDIVGGGIDARPPQPHRFVHSTAGQVLDRQLDDGAFEDRHRPGPVRPRR
ncbi:hypothetical protein, partial [Nocardia sp.]|uniref:hypothetical protein n=1 Tax=Nocardia sp. TaxID=1821 RepID=UPI0026354AAC